MIRYVTMALLASAFSAPAQAADRYCLLYAASPWMSNKVKIYVDEGTPGAPMKDFDVLKGKDGKPIKFSSVMEGVNYMAADGWEYVEAFALTSNNTNVYHFVMKKPS